MDKFNVCKFNVAREDAEEVGVLNFVYEKNASSEARFVMNSVFRLHLVARGKGTFRTLDRSVALKEGDIIVTLPSTNYSIVNEDGLEFLYISFVGLRAYKLLKRAGIEDKNSVKEGFSFVIGFWEDAVELATHGNIDLIAEGVLLYTLGRMCTARDEHEALAGSTNCIFLMKKQAEDRFSEPALCLKSLCEENFYNPKYVSALFKKVVGMGFSEYLASLRMNNALRLVESGFTSVKQIATLSGYTDALYFSKTFKKHFGMSPKDAIAAAARKQS